jgi:hypothetical protein
MGRAFGRGPSPIRPRHARGRRGTRSRRRAAVRAELTNFSAGFLGAVPGREEAFFSRFRDIVVSGEEKLLKPDPAIYYLALDRFGLKPGEALFIDDRIINVEGAQAVGMHAHLFTDAEDLRARLVLKGCFRSSPGRGGGPREAWWRGLFTRNCGSPNPLHQPAAGPPPRPGEDCRKPFARSHIVSGMRQSWPSRLWIVRHGQSAGNVAREAADAAGLTDIDIATRDVDVPLSALGQRQAARSGIGSPLCPRRTGPR